MAMIAKQISLMDENDLILTEEANQLHPDFNKKLKKVWEHYFSRNPKYWPIFKDPGIKKLLEHYNKCLSPDKEIQELSKQKKLMDKMIKQVSLPNNPTLPSDKNVDLLHFAAQYSKNWFNPSSVENVVGMASDPGIHGSLIGLIANPNLVHREYSCMSEDLEMNLIRKMATLAGYSPTKATGIFTQGGTFCNLYGYLLGIRKSLPEAKYYGMGYTHDYRFINSQGGHYSNTTNLSLLGINIKEKTIRIKMEEHNHMDLQDLEFQLESCFRLQCIVPTIMLTMGTTDTFAVDRVKPIRDIRDRLCEKYNIKVKPHIHVDSAVGWPILFYLNYDFEKNPHNINEETLRGLKRNTKLFHELKFADSYTLDFQKWGYVPYTSSLVMIKDKKDLKALENDPENFSYFEKETQGHSQLVSTIECSRGAAGLYGAYSALHYMGVDGFQIILASCLQNANYFRYLLNLHSNVKVLSGENQGPSVAFRMYNPKIIKNADAEYQKEYHHSKQHLKSVLKNTNWHRKVFLKRGKIGLYTNWVKAIAHSSYDNVGNFEFLPGEKAVFINPRTRRQDIDLFVKNLF